VGPRVGLDDVEKRKIVHCRESNPGRPARSPSLYRLSYPHTLFVKSNSLSGTLTLKTGIIIFKIQFFQIMFLWVKVQCRLVGGSQYFVII
jgi:hypothetical protein